MNFDAILIHVLACFLFHYDFLHNLLPFNHRLRSCILFKNDFIVLKMIAKCGLPWMDDFEDLVATGLPPHTMLLAQVQELKENHRRTADGMLREIRSEMDNRTMGGILSETRITELLRTELNVIRGKFNLLGGTQEDQHQHQHQQEVDATARNWLRRKVYFTAGKFRRAPEGWLFPTSTCAVMWSS